jgi:hypothetical protein
MTTTPHPNNTPDPDVTAAVVLPIDGSNDPPTAFFIDDKGYVDSWYHNPQSGAVTKDSGAHPSYPPNPDTYGHMWVPDFANHPLKGLCAAYVTTAHPRFILNSDTLIYPDPQLPIRRLAPNWFDYQGYPNVYHNPITTELTTVFQALQDNPLTPITAATNIPHTDWVILFSHSTYRLLSPTTPQTGTNHTLSDGTTTFDVQCALLGADNTIRVTNGQHWRTCTTQGTNQNLTLQLTTTPPWTTP